MLECPTRPWTATFLSKSKKMNYDLIPAKKRKETLNMAAGFLEKLKKSQTDILKDQYPQIRILTKELSLRKSSIKMLFHG